MNKFVFSGRLAQDVKYFPAKGDNSTGVARFNVAIDHRPNEDATFVSCVAFGKGADFAQKYLTKGSRYLFDTHVQHDKDKDGKVVGLQCIIENIEFVEPKKDTAKAE